MRVITDLGFGTVEVLPPGLDEPIEVTLENPDDPLGPKTTLRRCQVFPFSRLLVAQVVMISGMGPASTLIPMNTLGEAETFFNGPCSENETRLILNLHTRSFRISRQLGVAIERFLWLRTWWGRWNKEESGIPAKAEPTLDAYDRWREQCGGTGSGIFAPSFLDLKTNTILGFAVAVIAPRGIIYDVSWSQ